MLQSALYKILYILQTPVCNFFTQYCVLFNGHKVCILIIKRLSKFEIRSSKSYAR